jgi:hypothetical protein
VFRIKASVKVKPSEAYKKFRKEMKKIKGSYVSVGLHEDAGEYTSEDGEATGVSVVEVGLWNEFGTEHIPARSWLRSTLYSHEGEINRWRSEVVKQIMDGKITVEHALSTIGFRLRELMRAKILSNMPPPNAPSTVAAKKRDGVAPRTLVHTGLLSRSVEFRVHLTEAPGTGGEVKA